MNAPSALRQSFGQFDSDEVCADHGNLVADFKVRLRTGALHKFDDSLAADHVGSLVAWNFGAFETAPGCQDDGVGSKLFERRLVRFRVELNIDGQVSHARLEVVEKQLVLFEEHRSPTESAAKLGFLFDQRDLMTALARIHRCRHATWTPTHYDNLLRSRRGF